MTTSREADLLEQARRLLRQVAEETGTPAVYQAVTLAEMNLHWARWQLGSVSGIMPQLEEI